MEDQHVTALLRTERLANTFLFDKISDEPRWRGTCSHCGALALEMSVGTEAAPVVMQCMLCGDEPNWRKLEHDIFTMAPDVPTSISEIVSFDDLLDTDEEPFDWLVDNLIERGDRIMQTGLEGGGKSTLLRQFGAQCALGIHPFTLEAIKPIRVLIVDCENSRRQVRRKADRLRKERGAPLGFVFRPDGIDLALVEHIAWLEAKVREHQPELVIIGPIYKMAGGDPKDEQTAKAVAGVIDTLRVLYGFAVMIEAHTPYAEGAKSKRPERPYGASLWSRWPEFGIFLADDGTLRHWRGQRDERAWPEKLKRGDEWPWEVEIEARVERDVWDGPTHCMDAVYAMLRAASPQEFSGNQLQVAMRGTGDGFRDKTIVEAAERMAMQGRINVRNGARSARFYSVDNSQQATLGPADEPF